MTNAWHRHLAVSVIIQAVQDAQAGRADARQWLAEGGPDLLFWLNTAGLRRFWEQIRGGVLPRAWERPCVKDDDEGIEA